LGEICEFDDKSHVYFASILINGDECTYLNVT
jgi:hypothetical protein